MNKKQLYYEECKKSCQEIEDIKKSVVIKVMKGPLINDFFIRENEFVELDFMLKRKNISELKFLGE